MNQHTHTRTRRPRTRAAAWPGTFALLSLFTLAGCSDSGSADVVDNPGGDAPESSTSGLVWGESAWGEDTWNTRL